MADMLKSTGAMAGATLASRVLGMVREICYARFMGDGLVAGAFVLAFMIPNLFRRLLGEGAVRRPIAEGEELTHAYVDAAASPRQRHSATRRSHCDAMATPRRRCGDAVSKTTTLEAQTNLTSPTDLTKLLGNTCCRLLAAIPASWCSSTLVDRNQQEHSN